MNAKLLVSGFISEVGPGALAIGLLTRTALGFHPHHPMECYVTIPGMVHGTLIEEIHILVGLECYKLHLVSCSFHIDWNDQSNFPP